MADLAAYWHLARAFLVEISPIVTVGAGVVGFWLRNEAVRLGRMLHESQFMLENKELLALRERFQVQGVPGGTPLQGISWTTWQTLESCRRANRVQKFATEAERTSFLWDFQLMVRFIFKRGEQRGDLTNEAVDHLLQSVAKHLNSYPEALGKPGEGILKEFSEPSRLGVPRPGDSLLSYVQRRCVRMNAMPRDGEYLARFEPAQWATV